jgi:drug/metabolite transporter (DMT)-like permease
MAKIGRNIGLVWMYGKWIILAGGLYNLACAALLAGAFSYMGLVMAFILKTLFTAVVLYLHRQFEDRDAIFFYINLGLSRKRLMAATLSIDFGFLLLLEILIALCQ